MTRAKYWNPDTSDWELLQGGGAVGLSGYTVTNPVTNRSLNVSSDSLNNSLQVLGTVIGDLSNGQGGDGGGSFSSVNTISELRAVTGMSAGDSRYVRYHHTEIFGGGGWFDYQTATAKSLTVTAATDTFTNTNHTFQTGQGIRLYGTALPGGITNSTTTYYVVRTDANNFKVASSYDNAIAATPTIVDITSTGTAVTANYSDDNGVWIIPTDNAASGRWLRRLQNGEVSVRDYGAYGNAYNGASTQWDADLAAAQGATRYANTRGQQGGGYGLTVVFPDGYFVCNGSLKILRHVDIRGAGRDRTIVQPNGGAVNLFDFRHEYASPPVAGSVQTAYNSLKDMTVLGNDAASQIGIRIGGRNHTLLRDLHVISFMQGTGVQLTNNQTTNVYTEETQIENTSFIHNKTHLELNKGVGHESFSSTRVRGCVFDLTLGLTKVGVQQTAFSLTSGSKWYAGTIEAKVNQGADEGVTFDLGAAAIMSNNHYNVLVEGWVSPEATAGTLIKTAAGARVDGTGRIQYFGNLGTIANSLNASTNMMLNTPVGIFSSATEMLVYPWDQLAPHDRALVVESSTMNAYRWDVANTTADNGTTIRKPTGAPVGPGRWVRL